MTGITTVSSMALMQQEYSRFAEKLLQLFLFVFGAFCSSLVVGSQRKFHVGPFYSAVLAAVAVLYFAASFIDSAKSVLFLM